MKCWVLYFLQTKGSSTVHCFHRYITKTISKFETTLTYVLHFRETCQSTTHFQQNDSIMAILTTSEQSNVTVPVSTLHACHILLIGASLSKPHTSRTALCMCVLVYTSLLVCLLRAIYQAHLNLQRSSRACTQ